MKRLGFPDLLHFDQSNISRSCRYTCVCVCTIHQNVKLMLHTVQSHLTELATYHHCLARIMCNPPSPSSCLGECPVCPDTCLLKDEIVASLDKSDIDEIVFKQWVSTDRSTLETFCLSAEDFVDCLCEKLEALRPHSFIAKQPSFQVVRRV